MAVETRHWCEAQIYWGRECGRRAQYRVRGMWFCFKHDPRRKQKPEVPKAVGDDPEIRRLEAAFAESERRWQERRAQRQREREANFRECPVCHITKHLRTAEGICYACRFRMLQEQRQSERNQRLALLFSRSMPLNHQSEPKSEPPKETPTIAEQMSGKRLFLEGGEEKKGK